MLTEPRRVRILAASSVIAARADSPARLNAQHASQPGGYATRYRPRNRPTAGSWPNRVS